MQQKIGSPSRPSLAHTQQSARARGKCAPKSTKCKHVDKQNAWHYCGYALLRGEPDVTVSIKDSSRRCICSIIEQLQVYHLVICRTSASLCKVGRQPSVKTPKYASLQQQYRPGRLATPVHRHPTVTGTSPRNQSDNYHARFQLQLRPDACPSSSATSPEAFSVTASTRLVGCASNQRVHVQFA